MKITRKQLRRIINEEKEKLISAGLISESQFTSKQTSGGRQPPDRMALPKLYSNQVQQARRSNQLPPESSNWYRFAKSLDIGVLDLDELAYDMRFKSFDDLDASISPRSLNDRQVDEIIDIMFGISGAEEIEVLDALDD